MGAMCKYFAVSRPLYRKYLLLFLASLTASLHPTPNPLP